MAFAREVAPVGDYAFLRMPTKDFGPLNFRRECRGGRGDDPGIVRLGTERPQGGERARAAFSSHKGLLEEHDNMTLLTPIRYLLAASLLLQLALLAFACTGSESTPISPMPGPSAQPTTPPDFTPVVVVTPTGQIRNTLAISEPLPSTFIGEKVTVKGEGMAFENTIVVEVISGLGVLG